MKIRYFRGWASYLIIFTISSLVAGATVGAIAGIIISMLTGGDPEAVVRHTLLLQALGFLVSLPVSFLVYRWSVAECIVPQLAGGADRSVAIELEDERERP